MTETKLPALYGDGVQDDTTAIQARLDACVSVELPVPASCYLISQPLVLHSGQELRLSARTVIRLMPHSDCLMLRNESLYSTEQVDRDICVTGGIWDFDNLRQSPNPLYTKTVNVDWGSPSYSTDYLGVAFRFAHIDGFTLRGVTIKDPVTFGAQFAFVRYFTIENIRFDYNYGNPYAINMDGVHLDGGCEYGTVRNLSGACYDDLLAMNANDFFDGPITNIAVDGIFCQDCHSAVRLLSTRSQVKNITISNVFGTFYQYCIGFTKYYENRGDCGIFDNITLRDIHASKAPRLSLYQKDGTLEFSVIWMENQIDIGHLTIDGLHRCEETTPVPTVYVSPSAVIHHLSLSNVSQENHTGRPIALLENDAVIENLAMHQIDCGPDEVIAGSGSIRRLLTDAPARP